MAEERRYRQAPKPDLRVAHPVKKEDGSHEIRGYLGADAETLRKGYYIHISGEIFFYESELITDAHGRFGPISIPAFPEPEKTFTIYAVGTTANPIAVTLTGTLHQKQKTRYAPLSESLGKSWNPIKLLWNGIKNEWRRIK
ncbi:MAG: hypothetical protein HY472_00625 [Candidatus Sungbacteria bacterium]|nr:hypothetical protein [Candidatus Sungbacteria bacterium]